MAESTIEHKETTKGAKPSDKTKTPADKKKKNYIVAGGIVGLAVLAYLFLKDKNSGSSTSTASPTPDVTGNQSLQNGFGNGWDSGLGTGTPTAAGSNNTNSGPLSGNSGSISGSDNSTTTTTTTYNGSQSSPSSPSSALLPGAVNNPNGGNDNAAVTALNKAKAALAKAKASGNAGAVADATKNLAGAQSVVNSRNAGAAAAAKAGTSQPGNNAGGTLAAQLVSAPVNTAGKAGIGTAVTKTQSTTRPTKVIAPKK